MPDTAAEILRQHHKLLKSLHELVEALEQGDLRTNRQRLAEFLQNDFLPHCDAERKYLYPALRVLIHAVNRGSALLEIDHQFITVLAQQILDKIAPSAGDKDAGAEVRTLAIQLEALVSARIEKEEQVCLPLVERFLSDQEQEGISEALRPSPAGGPKSPQSSAAGRKAPTVSITRNHPERLLPAAGKAIESLQQYLAIGGFEALGRAFTMHPQALIDQISGSGLRGRGGGGFPTGAKWNTVLHSEGSGERYVCCNGAEGEPGTFKDRFILRANPYQVLEGLAIATYALDAKRAFVCLKSAFAPELKRVRDAIDEIRSAGIFGKDGLKIEVIEGPEEYLFGEEKALLEVIEGSLPLPRVLPPFIEGIFRHAPDSNPTLVNNVETLANVPHIIRNGAEWFRQDGTVSSPGSMVFTVCGDVIHPGCYELPLGTPLRVLIEECAGGMRHGRKLKAVLSGASNGVLSSEDLDVAMDFESLRAAGSGLGSAGFIVYDDSSCMVEVAALFSRFLYVESCGQCPPCKFGTHQITKHLARIQRGEGAEVDIDTCLEHCPNVAHGNRCGLPVGERSLVESIIKRFGDEFRAHLRQECRLERGLVLPKLVGFEDGRFIYDQRGVGYGNIEALLAGSYAARTIVLLGAFKFISWAVALGSGTSGGTLAPLFTIGSALGAMIGEAFVLLFPHTGINVDIAALVGMAAMFAGASRTLLTSVVFAFETTLEPLGLLPLLAGCTAAYLVSSLLMTDTIMTGKIARRGILVPATYLPDPLAHMQVHDSATYRVCPLQASITLEEIRAFLARGGPESGHHDFPVVNDHNEFLGIVTTLDLLDQGLPLTKTAGELAHGPGAIVHEDDSLRTAVDVMLREGVHRLAVTSPDEPHKLVAIISHSDILSSHRRRLREDESAEQIIRWRLPRWPGRRATEQSTQSAAPR